MPLTPLLIDRLQHDFPDFLFTPTNEFRWSFTQKTIFYDPLGETALLLHELAHALLGHADYTRDIQLIEMERDAWQYAKQKLFAIYGLEATDDEAENALDTYRDWLHARSTCPQCESTGVQIKESLYKCLACMTKWQVNDARICALRRYIVTQKTP